MSFTPRLAHFATWLPQAFSKGRRVIIAFGGFLVGTSVGRCADYPIQPVSFVDVALTGGFWQEHQEVNRRVTIPFAMKQCEESGRLANFDDAADTMLQRKNGNQTFQHVPRTIFPFDDTDAYKAIEGASYVLSTQKDPALEAKVDAWIVRIAAAQEPDGYLYTFRTMHPDSPAHKWVGQERWVNDPVLSHELYCAGHLYEAGVAYYQATGKRSLLDVCLKNADLLWKDFGDGRRKIAPGHQIVELALVKLHRVTGDPRWLSLAQTFLDNRGPGGSPYNQQDKRVVDQDQAEGHAVRANYMYSGMTDVAALTGDQRYFGAVTKIWHNVVDTKLYLTGGVGALAKGEAYGADYELPNDAYNETCAAVAFMMWNHRMFLMTGEAKYMDVFERTAYNGFISGVSESGDRFFYPNPLEYDGHTKNNSGFAGRAPWFGCACCPPNLMRMLASLSGYFYATRADTLFVNLYGQNSANMLVSGTKVSVSQETRYPWSGDIRLLLQPEHEAFFTVRLRIPGWAQNRPVPSDLYAYENTDLPAWRVLVAGKPVEAVSDKGYISITRSWKPGDSIELSLPMPVQKVRGNPKIAATRGRVAFERGPVVYCLEEVDDGPDVAGLRVSKDARTKETFRGELFGGVVGLDIEGSRSSANLAPHAVHAVPYFAWDNRGLGSMAVWLTEEASVDPRPVPVAQLGGIN